MTAILLLVAGLVILVLAGDLLVRGSVALAGRLGISPLIIGLTIVACGTSAPELVISLDAALSGAPGIALGNIVGSNIANVLLVLGVPSILAPTRCDAPMLTRNAAIMVAATLVFIALSYTAPLHLWQGAVLVALMAGFLWHAASRARHGHQPADGSGEGLPPVARPLRAAAFVLVGLVGLPLGARLAVTGAQHIAFALGMSEAAVGLTVVALGTSLPELAATTMAALRRESAIAVGNVVGSNIFNLLAIMGVTALAAPVPVSPAVLHVDLWVMLAAALVIMPFVYWRVPIGRLAGLGFFGVYLVYVAVVIGARSAALAGT